MARPATIGMLRKDGTETWLYEVLHSLITNQKAIERGQSAIVRGEVPDGSGGPLVDTSNFFYKPGLAGGQRGFGGFQPGENLIFSSTANADKGFIYLGDPTIRVALDEDAGLVGINVTVPQATLHLEPGGGGVTTLVPDADVVTGTGWDGWRNAASALIGPPVYPGVNTLDDDTSWSGVSDVLGTNTQTFSLDGTITPDRVWTVTIRVSTLSGTCSRAGIAFSHIEFRINDANGDQFVGLNDGTFMVNLSPSGEIATGLTTAWYTFTRIIDCTGTPAATGVTPNVIVVGMEGQQSPSTPLYIRATYIALSTGGDSDLIRWNNSSSTLLGKLNASGHLGIGTGSASLDTAMCTIIPDTSATIGQIIKGASSQTARLLQLQNSTGTELGGFTHLGAHFFISGGATGRIWTSDSGGVGSWGLASGLATRVQFEWRANGPYQTGTEVDGQLRIPTGFTISSVRLFRKTAGSAGSTIVDLNKNGTTMYTTQGNRPTVTAAGGNNQSSSGTLPDVTSVAAGDVLSIDTDQIETGTPVDFVLIIEGA